jgi:hypothetical protein
MRYKGSFKICLPIAMYYLAVLTDASIETFSVMFREIGAYYEERSILQQKLLKL